MSETQEVKASQISVGDEVAGDETQGVVFDIDDDQNEPGKLWIGVKLPTGGFSVIKRMPEEKITLVKRAAKTSE